MVVGKIDGVKLHSYIASSYVQYNCHFIALLFMANDYYQRWWGLSYHIAGKFGAGKFGG